MIDSESIAVIATSAFAAACVVQCFYGWIRGRIEKRQKMLVVDKTDNGPVKQLTQVCQRLNELEEKMSRVEAFDQQLQKPAEPSYEIAADLVRMGATRDELMLSCGLIRAEAEMMIAVHGAKPGNGS